jgi:NAD(P)-dependent dehydrogenase (short-subunit alcohol dehydrogenase family)
LPVLLLCFFDEKVRFHHMRRRTIVVTGASSGIGRATAKLFLREGETVVAVGRDTEQLNALHDANGPGRLDIRTAELSDTDEVDRLTREVTNAHEKIDVLVNAAGVIKNGTIENSAIDEWDSMMNINLRSVFYLMQCFIPALKETKGNIINVSSVAGTRAFPNVLAYCVSKAGLDQLTRCAALELAHAGIRVNAVNPGVVVTNIHKRGGMNDADYDRFLEHSKTTHPLGRVGQPEEVASLIHFLASEQASWITGATYEIDGGRGQTCAR